MVIRDYAKEFKLKGISKDVPKRYAISQLVTTVLLYWRLPSNYLFQLLVVDIWKNQMQNPRLYNDTYTKRVRYFCYEL